MTASIPRRLLWRVRHTRPERLLHRWRRAALIVRARASAEWHRAELELDIAPDIRMGRGVRVRIEPHTQGNLISIGPRSALDDRVLFRLAGGRIRLGPETELRRDVVLNVGGELTMEHHNIMGWSVVVHCSERVHWERFASAAENATVADSTHYFTEPDTFFYENTRSAPITIGANTWLCPKSTVTSGVRVGSHCIVGSNSVVVKDVPDGHLASGIPAAVRPLDLPWDGARA